MPKATPKKSQPSLQWGELTYSLEKLSEDQMKAEATVASYATALPSVPRSGTLVTLNPDGTQKVVKDVRIRSVGKAKYHVYFDLKDPVLPAPKS